MNFLSQHKTLISPIFLFLIFTTGLIFVQRPWEDEAMFSCASYNLAKNGYLAVPGFRRALGTVGVEKHIFWLPPLNMIAGAGWYKIFGYSVFSRRFLSCTFGLAGLIFFYLLLKKLKFEDKLILTALLLTSVDFLYTRYSGDGRLCDIMCNTLCLAGFVFYLLLREKNFILSVFVSNLFITMACLTHPNALLGLAGLIFLILFFDLKKITLISVMVFVLPYIIGIISVSFYIFEDIEAFLSQFWYGNVLTAEKQNLFELIKNEFVKRYGMIYLGSGLKFPTLSKILVIIPLIYFSSLIYTGFKIKENVSIKIMFYLTVMYFFIMTFVLTKKWNIQYLIHIIPFYNFCVALLYIDLKKAHKFLSNLILALMIVLPTGINSYRYIKNDYKKYVSDIEGINKIIGINNGLYGPLELGFGFGWDRVADDNTLGFLSGKDYNYLVSSKNYNYIGLDGHLMKYYPEVYKYQQEKFKKFALLWTGKIYNLYGRKD